MSSQDNSHTQITEGKSRNGFIDYLRGVGIILVVLGHAIQFGSGAAYSESGAFFENPVFRVIYSFHMPFFLLISGYLAAFSVSGKSFRKLFRHKCGTLLLPIFVWGTIQFIIENCLLNPDIILSKIHSSSLPAAVTVLKAWLRYCITGNWFLWAVLLCTLLVGLVYDLFHDHAVLYVIIWAILLILMFVTPDNYNFHLYKFVFPFFLAAFLARMALPKQNLSSSSAKASNSNKGSESDRNSSSSFFQAFLLNRKYQIFILVFVLIAYLLLLHFFHTDSYIYVSRFTLIGKDNPAQQLGIDLYRTVLGASGCCVCIMICRLLYSTAPSKKDFSPTDTANPGNLRTPSGIRLRFRKYTEELGRNSLGIYLLSGILYQDVIAKLWVNHNHNILLNFVETLLMLLFCNLITKLISRSRILRKLLLGGR